MKASRNRLLLIFALLVVAVVLLSGCVGYPVRAKVSSAEVAARIGTSSNRLETIVARYTYHRCVMLLTPEGALQDWVHSMDKDYFLRRADHSTAALPFLRGRDWKKILPVSSTNLWVAISQPERRGSRDDLEVVVFQDDDLIHERSLRTIALAVDRHYTGFLAFSPVRWVIWYPAEEDQVQYDILNDSFIYPLQEWEKNEGETLMWMPGDVALPPPE